MKTEHIKTLIDSRGVAFITLHRPDVHNVFNDEMILEMTAAFREWERDDSIRLVVVTGEGKSFCAGADINWMKKMKDYGQEENFKDSLRLAELFETINYFSRPVVAKVNGAALGGGAGLVSVCDFAVAVERAQFGLTEVTLGLVPAVISPYVMAKIGESNARAFFLSGMRFSAKRAYEMGLIHDVVTDKEGLNQVVESIISQFLKAGPHATKVAKKLIRRVKSMMNQSDAPDMALKNFTCETISEIRVGVEAQEGMSALLEKRSPLWVKSGES